MGDKFEAMGTVYAPPSIGNGHLLTDTYRGDNSTPTHRVEQPRQSLILDAADAHRSAVIKPDRTPPVVRWSTDDKTRAFTKDLFDSLKHAWQVDPEDMDPGFSGGAAAIAKRRASQGAFLRAILKGESYSQARAEAGMPRDMDPGFGGGEEQLTRNAQREAKLLQEIANGTPYQSARKRAGLAPDMDPGFSGGDDKIAENLRRRAAKLGITPQHER